MKRNELSFADFDTPSRARNATEWDLMECDRVPAVKGMASAVYPPNWAELFPDLIANLASEILEKKKMELRFNSLEVLLKECRFRIEKLESSVTKIVPINTFAPEPYEILKPILVCVQAVNDEFEAGWFDANIHTTGDNDAEAVNNLKSLILDYYDSFSKEPVDNLGREPKRQLLIMNQFLKRKD